MLLHPEGRQRRGKQVQTAGHCFIGVRSSVCFCTVTERKAQLLAASRQRDGVRPSVSRYQLIVPRHRRSMIGLRAFSVVGTMTWNSLPDNLRDPTLSGDKFRAALKTQFFSKYITICRPLAH